MVINPVVLIREIDGLIALGISVSPDRLEISQNAHLITPAHVALEKALESSKKGRILELPKRASVQRTQIKARG